MVRSSHAHGIIKGIDTTAAKAMPGVLGVWTGKDLEAAGYGPFTCGLPLKSRDGSPLLQTNRPALATDKVRFVGDPVAFVVAETLAQARDAAEAVELDIEPLPAVTDAAEAAKPGAPQLYDHIPNNVALDYHYGDTAKIDAAFATAAHVTRLDIDNTRVAVVAMEPRVALAPTTRRASATRCRCRRRASPATSVDAGEDPEGAERQGPHPHRQCRRLVRHEERQLSRIYLHPARREGAGPAGEVDRRALDQLPVRQPGPRAATSTPNWRSTPTASSSRCACSGYGNLGAYITGVAPGPLSLNTGKNLASVYRTPLLGVDIKMRADQHHADGRLSRRRPARGQLLHGAADRPRRRRDGHRPARPCASATSSSRRSCRSRPPSGVTYDSGDFAGVFDKALEISDHADFARRKKESRKSGKLRGIAVGSYLEVTAPPSGELGKITFEPDGARDADHRHARLRPGPRHAVRAGAVGAARRAVRQHHGWSRTTAISSASATAPAARARSRRRGQAIVEASALVIAKGKQAAAHLLEAVRSRHRIRRTAASPSPAPIARIGIMELAQRMRDGKTAGGRARHRSTSITPPRTSPSTFPNGCHVAEVEIDPDTGVTRIVRYTARQRFRHRRQSDDRRRPVAWRRRAGHRPGADGGSQLRLPAASRSPARSWTTPCRAPTTFRRWQSATIPRRPRPIRSAPRAAAKPAAPAASSAIVNAVVDALSEYGITHIDMPLTPERVWRAIQDAKAKAA